MSRKVGFHHSPETIAKMRAANKGQRPAPQTIAASLAARAANREQWIQKLAAAGRGKVPGNWKGGRLFKKRYVYVLDKGVYRLEHRVVMEKALGRPLLRSEIVHHKNHDRLDNRIENLELLVSQSAHLRLYHKRGCSI